MAIEIKKLEKGAAIQFPFELKDKFRKAFPSAKWNRDSKRWEVGPRTIKRLEIWVKEVNESGIVEKIENRDAVDLEEQEIEELRSRIEQIKREIDSENQATAAAEEAKERHQQTKADLKKIKEKLDTAKAERKKAEAEEKEARQSVEEIVSEVADIDDIVRLRKEMLRQWTQTAKGRKRFEEHQDELREIRDDLENVGIRCRALKAATSANYNRRDRDRDDLFLKIEFEVIDNEG